MKKITLSLLSIIASVIMASAQAPAAFNYQGIARSASGAPLSSKVLGMRISIHDGSSTGATVFQETQNVTTNAYGLYNVVIGSGIPVTGSIAGVAWGTGSKYIQIEVDAAGGTTYTDLGTSQLLSVPYALNAGSGGSSISGTANTIAKFTGTTALGNSQIKDDGTNVSIGVTSPGAKFHLVGSSNTSATIGALTFDHQAMLVQTSTSSTSQVATGVVGFAGNSTLENHGLTGFAGSSSGGSSYNIGGFFLGSPGSTSTGLSVGAYGNAGSGANNIGIYGTTVSTGTGNYGGYFSGNVLITGLVSKGGGSFKIDHPLDPGNKYLYHSFVESPDMMNIYNGNIITDAQGFAMVTMPSYFDALNKDFRYQLTVIGTFAQAIVKEKMSGNTFRIQTSVPNVEVSWQVTGVRQDAFANAHRIVPEVAKETENKGKYLHPVELGLPITKEINYDLNHRITLHSEDKGK